MAPLAVDMTAEQEDSSTRYSRMWAMRHSPSRRSKSSKAIGHRILDTVEWR
jgi:hypothetical protein